MREEKTSARADRLEKRRHSMDQLSCDNQIDDLMLADEIADIFEHALSVCGLTGEALAVMQLRLRFAAHEAVDLMMEDMDRRELLR